MLDGENKYYHCKAARWGTRQNERDKLNDISKDRQETPVTAGG